MAPATLTETEMTKTTQSTTSGIFEEKSTTSDITKEKDLTPSAFSLDLQTTEVSTNKQFTDASMKPDIVTEISSTGISEHTSIRDVTDSSPATETRKPTSKLSTIKTDKLTTKSFTDISRITEVTEPGTVLKAETDLTFDLESTFKPATEAVNTSDMAGTSSKTTTSSGEISTVFEKSKISKPDPTFDQQETTTPMSLDSEISTTDPTIDITTLGDDETSDISIVADITIQTESPVKFSDAPKSQTMSTKTEIIKEVSTELPESFTTRLVSITEISPEKEFSVTPKSKLSTIEEETTSFSTITEHTVVTEETFSRNFTFKADSMIVTTLAALSQSEDVVTEKQPISESVSTVSPTSTTLFKITPNESHISQETPLPPKDKVSVPFKLESTPFEDFTLKSSEEMTFQTTTGLADIGTSTESKLLTKSKDTEVTEITRSITTEGFVAPQLLTTKTPVTSTESFETITTVDATKSDRTAATLSATKQDVLESGDTMEGLYGEGENVTLIDKTTTVSSEAGSVIVSETTVKSTTIDKEITIVTSEATTAEQQKSDSQPPMHLSSTEEFDTTDVTTAFPTQTPGITTTSTASDEPTTSSLLSSTQESESRTTEKSIIVLTDTTSKATTFSPETSTKIDITFENKTDITEDFESQTVLMKHTTQPEIYVKEITTKPEILIEPTVTPDTKTNFTEESLPFTVTLADKHSTIQTLEDLSTEKEQSTSTMLIEHVTAKEEAIPTEKTKVPLDLLLSGKDTEKLDSETSTTTESIIKTTEQTLSTTDIITSSPTDIISDVTEKVQQKFTHTSASEILESETSTVPRSTEKSSVSESTSSTATTVSSEIITDAVTTSKSILITDSIQTEDDTPGITSTVEKSFTELTLPEETDDCFVNGTTYKDSQIITPLDPCEKCYCSSGEVMCSKIICKLPKEGCVLTNNNPSACCANYECPDEDDTKPLSTTTIRHETTEIYLTTPIPIMFSTIPSSTASTMLVTEREKSEEITKEVTESATEEEFQSTSDKDVFSTVKEIITPDVSIKTETAMLEETDLKSTTEQTDVKPTQLMSEATTLSHTDIEREISSVSTIDTKPVDKEFESTEMPSSTDGVPSSLVEHDLTSTSKELTAFTSSEKTTVTLAAEIDTTFATSEQFPFKGEITLATKGEKIQDVTKQAVTESEEGMKEITVTDKELKLASEKDILSTVTEMMTTDVSMTTGTTVIDKTALKITTLRPHSETTQLMSETATSTETEIKPKTTSMPTIGVTPVREESESTESTSFIRDVTSDLVEQDLTSTLGESIIVTSSEKTMIAIAAEQATTVETSEQFTVKGEMTMSPEDEKIQDATKQATTEFDELKESMKETTEPVTDKELKLTTEKDMLSTVTEMMTSDVSMTTVISMLDELKSTTLSPHVETTQLMSETTTSEETEIKPKTTSLPTISITPIDKEFASTENTSFTEGVTSTLVEYDLTSPSEESIIATSSEKTMVALSAEQSTTVEVSEQSTFKGEITTTSKDEKIQDTTKQVTTEFDEFKEGMKEITEPVTDKELKISTGKDMLSTVTEMMTSDVSVTTEITMLDETDLKSTTLRPHIKTTQLMSETTTSEETEIKSKTTSLPIISITPIDKESESTENTSFTEGVTSTLVAYNLTSPSEESIIITSSEKTIVALSAEQSTTVEVSEKSTFKEEITITPKDEKIQDVTKLAVTESDEFKEGMKETTEPITDKDLKITTENDTLSTVTETTTSDLSRKSEITMPGETVSISASMLPHTETTQLISETTTSIDTEIKPKTTSMPAIVISPVFKESESVEDTSFPEGVTSSSVEDDLTSTSEKSTAVTSSENTQITLSAEQKTTVETIEQSTFKGEMTISPRDEKIQDVTKLTTETPTTFDILKTTSEVTHEAKEEHTTVPPEGTIKELTTPSLKTSSESVIAETALDIEKTTLLISSTTEDIHKTTTEITSEVTLLKETTETEELSIKEISEKTTIREDFTALTTSTPSKLPKLGDITTSTMVTEPESTVTVSSESIKTVEEDETTESVIYTKEVSPLEITTTPSTIEEAKTTYKKISITTEFDAETSTMSGELTTPRITNETSREIELPVTLSTSTLISNLTSLDMVTVTESKLLPERNESLIPLSQFEKTANVSDESSLTDDVFGSPDIEALTFATDLTKPTSAVPSTSTFISTDPDFEIVTELFKENKTITSLGREGTDKPTSEKEADFSTVILQDTSSLTSTKPIQEESETTSFSDVTDKIFTFVSTRFTDLTKEITEFITIKPDNETQSTSMKDTTTVSTFGLSTDKMDERLTPLIPLTRKIDMDNERSTTEEGTSKEAETTQSHIPHSSTEKPITKPMNIETTSKIQFVTTDTSEINATLKEKISSDDILTTIASIITSQTLEIVSLKSELEKSITGTGEPIEKVSDQAGTERIQDDIFTSKSTLGVVDDSFTEKTTTLSPMTSLSTQEKITTSDVSEITPSQKIGETSISTQLLDLTPDVKVDGKISTQEETSKMDQEARTESSTFQGITASTTEEKTFVSDVSFTGTTFASIEEIKSTYESRGMSDTTKLESETELSTEATKKATFSDLEKVSRATRKDMELETTPISFTKTEIIATATDMEKSDGEITIETESTIGVSDEMKVTTLYTKILTETKSPVTSTVPTLFKVTTTTSETTTNKTEAPLPLLDAVNMTKEDALTVLSSDDDINTTTPVKSTEESATFTTEKSKEYPTSTITGITRKFVDETLESKTTPESIVSTILQEAETFSKSKSEEHATPATIPTERETVSEKLETMKTTPKSVTTTVIQKAETVTSTTETSTSATSTTEKPSTVPVKLDTTIFETIPTQVSTFVTRGEAKENVTEMLTKGFKAIETTPFPFTTTHPSLRDSETTTKEGDDYLIDETNCYYQGRVYVSAEQVLREDPCEFCFCFRGDIICLQQSCPPPANNCEPTTIPGFCCPRYECPVYLTTRNMTQLTRRKGATPIIIHQKRIDKREIRPTIEVKGCQVNGTFYELGKPVTSVSGPCLQCVCQEDGIMHCDPQRCKPQPPLMLKMNNSYFRRR